ncbi:unnamed protein product [Nippostrongylus brasiliensis]|uniref:Reverse transcriptase domain-containing protein n=1 Tax=Nippostrongylus brasiliensis TaxID=27835 RepID=A0A0N4YYV5_NIPBR|nr:unnamed protein product [Nippostrongylus brasiliensis]
MSRKPQVRVTFFSEFVDESIDELLDVGAIETVEAKPRVVSPLAVAQGKKLRLILDLSWLNSFVASESIRFEDMSKAFHMLGSAKYFSTFDMKSGYHHVSVHKDFVKFLGLRWKDKF